MVMSKKEVLAKQAEEDACALSRAKEAIDAFLVGRFQEGKPVKILEAEIFASASEDPVRRERLRREILLVYRAAGWAIEIDKGNEVRGRHMARNSRVLFSFSSLL